MSYPYNYYQVRDGHYDWLHQNETQTQYVFYLRDDAPFEKKSFGVVLTNLAEEHFDTVFDCAEAVYEALSGYIHHPDLDKVGKLVEYLTPYLYKDQLAKLLEEKSRLSGKLKDIEREICITMQNDVEYQKLIS